MRWPFLTRDDHDDATDHPTSRWVDDLLHRALAAGASDVHVAPTPGGGGTVRFRVDGFFRDQERLEPELFPRVIARLKVLAGCAVFRTAEPQDGRLTVDGHDLRLSTLPVVGGEKAVLRVLGGADRPRELDDLGLHDDVATQLRELARLPSGVIFLTGPCSTGKTTTLHALARAILAERGEWANVVSVEDPVEQVVEGMAQTEVDPRRGLGFPEALAAILRQDPEVVLIGETRDPETARIAIEAGFTGHLVLSSLHVGDPEEVPRRLELLGVPSYLVLDGLRAVVNQRLVRRPCPDCRDDVDACRSCGGHGHRGRLALAEIVRFERGTPSWLTPRLDELARAELERGRTTAAELRRVLGVEAA
ncbi:MAG: ATPase, T2SS/T4P/T4SS family [Acidobacteriota bacterium]